MRKYMLMVLFATSAAMPAVAQDRGSDRHRDGGAQNESSEARDEARAARRAQRAERPQGTDRATTSERGAERQRAVVQAPPAVDQQAPAERRTSDRRRSEGGNGLFSQMQRQRSSTPDAPRGDAVVQPQQRQVRGTDRRSDRSVMGQVFEQNRERRGEVTAPRAYDRDRSRYSGSNRQWSGQWRNDRNYDWRHYRDRNRSVYRLGNYWDPYGSSYRRFSIGYSLFPNYYQSNYWLDDPWMYRLPPAYGPYRWVRYYGDALLVNIYTGQVVDVVHSFFW